MRNRWWQPPRLSDRGAFLTRTAGSSRALGCKPAFSYRVSSLAALAEDGGAVQLPGGKLRMGSGSAGERSGSGPRREVSVKPFALDRYPVTNRDFR